MNNNQRYVYLENKVGEKRNWSVVQLRGRKSNSHGIGARVVMTTASGIQTREIHLGSGYLMSPPPEAHFGLGDCIAIDRLEVRWPSGQVDVFIDLDPNRVIVVEEAGAMNYWVPGAAGTLGVPTGILEREKAPRLGRAEDRATTPEVADANL